ncbi:carbohydrate porin [Acinetobacter nectaris]|uniref:carbohydrate porin n=1 Tax=Acinetobacter nectaris TaxID=1219382 RepID=UPI003B00924C|nr:carbohydrate porin [Acinetobacter nectaris]
MSSLIFRLSICTMMVSGLTQVHAEDAFNAKSPYMLGDWAGERTALKQRGYDFSLEYTGELANLLDSKNSSSHGTAYSDQIKLGANLDLSKILGWNDTQAQLTITHRSGQNLTNTSDALNGQLSSVQEVWGRGQTWRLTDLWIKKQFFNQALDIKVGRFGEAEDFNSFECNFQNLALCGGQVGNWEGDQWYNWPVSQWAARVKYNVEPNLYVQVGAFEHNPENLERGKGFNLSTDGSDGAVIPVEVVWQPKISTEALPGEYRLGYSYSTVDQNSRNVSVSHKQSTWISAKQQLTARHGDLSRGLTGSFSTSFFDNDTKNIDDSQISNMQNIGLTYTGLFDARPQDEIALGFARIHKSGARYDSEYDAELYYGLHPTNWLTVRPNVQYVRHIGALKDGNNAWVGGVKLITAF